MIWSKMKQQLEGFLSPALVGRIEYRASGYRYLPDKSGRCYITVDKKDVFNMCDSTKQFQWYESEQDIKNDPKIQLPITVEEIEMAKKETLGKVPEDRLAVIIRNRKAATYAKEMMIAQGILSKSDFFDVANSFLSEPIEKSLESKEILINVLALVDRRVGKKRILSMEESIKLRHPIVQYFYELRKRA